MVINYFIHIMKIIFIYVNIKTTNVLIYLKITVIFLICCNYLFNSTLFYICFYKKSFIQKYNLLFNYYHDFCIIVNKNYVTKLIKFLINYAHNNKLYYK